MSYEKQTWATGDTITANKLNHMEDGIAAGGSADFDLILEYTNADTEYAHGASFDELYSMITNGEFPNVLVKYMTDGIYTERAYGFSARLNNNVKTIYIYNNSWSEPSSGAVHITETGILSASSIYEYTYDNTTRVWTLVERPIT